MQKMLKTLMYTLSQNFHHGPYIKLMPAEYDQYVLSNLWLDIV